MVPSETPADAPLLLIRDEGASRVLTLNRPARRNALNDALLTALCEALRQAQSDPGVRTIIVEGAGKKADITGRVSKIKRQIDETTSDYDREKLQERLAKLAGGVARLQKGRLLCQPLLCADSPHLHPCCGRASEQAHAYERIAAQ